MDKALAKKRLRGQKCPYCGAVRKDLAYGNVENDGKEVFEEPNSKLQGIFDCKEFYQFFDSLANPAASYGECARCAVQGVDCTLCEKQFTEVYSFRRVILTDYPGEDFRVDFND